MRRRLRPSPRSSSPALHRACRPVISQLEERTLLSTVTWASDVSGDWDNPSMWTGGAVPGPSDDAVISFSDITVTHDTSASDTVDSVNCAATLDISSGSLSIDTTSPSAPTSTVSGQFTLTGASLQLLSGNLNLTGGGTFSGSITGVAGTTVNFLDSPYSFSANSSLSTAGSVGFYSSVVTEDGAYDVSQSTTVDYASTATFTAPITDLGSDLNVSGVLNLPGQSFSLATVENSGTINGGGGASMTVTGSMTWDGGTIRGFGALDIADGATLQINVNPSLPLTLDGVELENAGAAALTLANCCGGVLALENGAGINNSVTGSFAIQGGDGVARITSDGTATFFENEGSLTAASSDSAFSNTIEPTLTQTASGTTSVQAGSMSFYGGAVQRIDHRSGGDNRELPRRPVQFQRQFEPYHSGERGFLLVGSDRGRGL